jgi:uncharacterized protein (DUF433 family)
MGQMPIAHDDNVLGGEPRIEGTRVGVRHVGALGIDSGESPARVAEQLDVSLAEVYEARTYDDDHVEEIRAIERENQDAFDQVREESLQPKV